MERNTTKISDTKVIVISEKKDLDELKEKDLKQLLKSPAIGVYQDDMSLGAILSKSYIQPKLYLRKQGIHCIGINSICESFAKERVVFTGQGGIGKTTAFKLLYSGNCHAIKNSFYYMFAPNLLKNKRALNAYQKAIRNIIDYGLSLPGILLLDGLEEAYLNNREAAKALFEKLEKTDIVFWVSCRTSFYEILDNSTVSLFQERIEICDWDEHDYDAFFDLSLEGNKDSDVIKQRLGCVKANIDSLLRRPLFATMTLFIAQNNELGNIHNEYELIDQFLHKWIERENEKGNVSNEDLYETASKTALNLYLHPDMNVKYDENMSIIRDLLVIPSRSTIIRGFYHREFLIYFIVHAIMDAALNNPQKINFWFAQTFYDDITNLFKPIIKQLAPRDIRKMYDNLFNVYKDSYDRCDDIEDEFKSADLLPIEKSILKLRDEILYFILKLPNIDYNTFAKYVYERINGDTMLFLGLAYGMSRNDPNNPYTMEYAEKLYPGTPEDIRNRGWGMCFFGDVLKDGYEYEDDEELPWDKVRNNRLNRLSDDKERYYTRCLDIPLLYCYYYSRGFRDCNSVRDYFTIMHCNTSLKCFQTRQKQFMETQKEKLASEYLKHLLQKHIYESCSFAGCIEKENIKMDLKSNTISIEIDKGVADSLLNEIDQKSIVRNNIKDFWKLHGSDLKNQYKDILVLPEHKNIKKAYFDSLIRKCRILIISANYVEGTIITRRLIQASETDKLDVYVESGHRYQFATINSIPILHVWPADIGSFTMYGSYDALQSALSKFDPYCVISLGVAFGINPSKQHLGDVLIAKKLYFYDFFNKVTDGQIKLSNDNNYSIDVQLTSQVKQIEYETPPVKVGSFKWKYGDMLSGGTVLSDVVEKGKIVNAAKQVGADLIGGEMESSGIYYACQKNESKKIPFMVIKGICDWGAEKNSWDSLIGDGNENINIKDLVQAYACSNAFDAMEYIIEQLNIQ